MRERAADPARHQRRMHAAQQLMWFRRLALAGAALAAIVVVLGAWVRLTDAGLGCPDWPGCYGHLYPQSSDAAGKAWHEMIHRYCAGALVLVIGALLGWAGWRRKDRSQPLAPVALLFILVCAQAVLGALTVTQRLRPLIVTAHLLGGLTTLGLLWWLSIAPQRRDPIPSERALRPLALAAAGVLLMQLFLGGWTSANYAAVACPDIPTCQGRWWPPMDFGDAFVPWQGSNGDYEGGALTYPARTAIQVIHRLGALVTGSVLLLLAATALVHGRGRLAGAGLLLAGAVVVQILLGVAMVRSGVPLSLATLHNGGAALLVVCMVWLLRALWPAVPESAAPIGVVPLRRVNRAE